MKKVILASVLGLTLISANTTPSLVSAETINNSIVDLENYEVIKLPEISDENLELALEIAKSDLEEKSIFLNGQFKNFYDNHVDANVSQEAFDVFNDSLIVLNNAIKKGELTISGDIKDIQVNEELQTDIQGEILNPEEMIIIPTFTVTNEWYGQVISISADEASKIQKVLAAGGGVTGLIAILTGIGTIWATTLAALYGVGELCNWNNNGYYVHRSHFGLGFTKPTWCTPK